MTAADTNDIEMPSVSSTEGFLLPCAYRHLSS